MDPETVAQIVIAGLALAGILITQAGLHRRWAREQDDKREQTIKAQDDKRRQEQAEMIRHVTERGDKVIETAVELMEVERRVADQERDRAAEAARAHAECRQEVAQVSGQVQELRIRVGRAERLAGHETRMVELHGGLKHDALGVVAAAEGTIRVVKDAIPKCTCDALAPVRALVDGYKPRGGELIEENKQIHRLAAQLLEEENKS